MRKAEVDRQAIVATMVECIAQHLREPITAHDLAEAAGYSQFHAARVLNAETGMTPFQYIRRERLMASAFALRAGESTVLDVALDFVFDSHEGFTRAFSRGFGIPPKRFASRPTPVGWLIPYQYLDRNRATREQEMVQTAVVFTQIIERPVRKLILKRSKKADDYFSYVEEVGCGDGVNSAPWDVLVGIKEALYEPVGLWLPENMRPTDTGMYAHGVEVAADYAGAIPDGFDVIDLPSSQMLVFQGEPYDDADYQAAVGVCMDRIETFQLEVYGYEFAPELAPRMQLAPQGWRGYIEMRPVRPVVS